MPTKPVKWRTPVALSRAPKIDLHRHLLGSARPETLWALVRKYDVGFSAWTLRAFRNTVVHGASPGSLSRYIAPWEVFRAVVQAPEDVHRIAFEAATDAAADGVRYVEFRASLPGMPVTDGSLPQTRIPAAEYLGAVEAAFAEVPGIACRLVASVTRHAVGAAAPAERRKYAREYFKQIDQFRDRLIVGADLSGLESGYPATLFKEIFAEARAMALAITVHAGETEGPREVWAAIDELGACRIGHGTSAPQDPKLVDELIARKIVLEVCPTAGWLVGSVPDRRHHPVINCERPLLYVICTDNPTLNSSSQSQELQIAAKIAGREASTFAKWQFSQATHAAFSPSALLELADAGH